MSTIQISSAREAAFAALTACEKQHAWSDQAIKNESKKRALSARDAALAARLCYGVVQNQLLLDDWINAYSKTPSHKLDAPVRLSLRLGLYQLYFLDRIPANAAVNESVNLVRKYTKNKGAAGLTNAVLRAFQRRGEVPLPKELSLRYSHPAALVALLEQELGGDVEPLLAVNNTPTEIVLQTNTQKTTTQALLSSLVENGVEAEGHPWMDDCLLVQKSGDLEQLEPFRQGHFYVQDCAAKLAALIADPQPGDKVLDACAAPGGKSFACAMRMEDQGEILSRDMHENKLRRIQSGAKRLGLQCIHTAAADARVYQPELEHYFDVVLADVPCSGLGIIRKKPDIRYKDLKETEHLPAIQLDILANVARYVRPGGTLVYSTCTVLRRENEAVVETFLRENPEFSLEAFTVPGPIGQAGGQITLWPHIHGTDGFFIAKLRRAEA